MTTKTTPPRWFDFAGSKGALLSRHLVGWVANRRASDERPDREQSEVPSRAWLVPIGLITLFMLWTVITV